MKKINWVIFFCTAALLIGCYNRIAGYNGGRKYDLVNSNRIYFDFTVNAVYLIDRPKKDFNISFYKTDTLISHYGFSDTAKLKNYYAIPDSPLAFSKSKKLSILIIADQETYYELYVNPSDWLKKERIYGYVRQYR